MTDYRSKSLWLDDYPGSLDPRPALRGDTQVDVAIVGCVGELAAGPDRQEKMAGNDAARRFLNEVFDSVDEVGRVCEAEVIDCRYAKGGTIRLARSEAQLARQHDQVSHDQSAFGLSDADLRTHKRPLSPLYSLMVATEPLESDVWDEIGLADRQTFSDNRHPVIYGQRTGDGESTSRPGRWVLWA